MFTINSTHCHSGCQIGALTAGFMHPMKAGFNKLIAHGVTGGVRSRLSGGSLILSSKL
jgi:hypothetical protein